MLRQGWCHFGGICGRLTAPWGRGDGQRHVGAAFGLMVSPAWALCLAVCAFRAMLGKQAGQCSRPVCVFPRLWVFDETCWRCGINLAEMARRSICSIDNLLAICKNETVKKHYFLQHSPDQKIRRYFGNPSD